MSGRSGERTPRDQGTGAGRSRGLSRETARVPERNRRYRLDTRLKIITRPARSENQRSFLFRNRIRKLPSANLIPCHTSRTPGPATGLCRVNSDRWSCNYRGCSAGGSFMRAPAEPVRIISVIRVIISSPSLSQTVPLPSSWGLQSF